MNKEGLIESLKACGLKLGDNVLVHSDISKLGSGLTISETCQLIYESIRYVIDKGTIFVPAFFYEYARNKETFHVDKTPPSRDLGLFPLWFWKNKATHRSLNPITSLCADGLLARLLRDFPTASAYGPGSGFDVFSFLQGKMVFIGAGLRDITYVHYVEHKVGVPHLYNKYYETGIYENGERLRLPVQASVRYLGFDVPLDQDGNNKKFKNAGIVKDDGLVKVISADDCFQFLAKELSHNFFYLLKRKPDFKEGELPLI